MLISIDRKSTNQDAFFLKLILLFLSTGIYNASASKHITANHLVCKVYQSPKVTFFSSSARYVKKWTVTLCQVMSRHITCHTIYFGTR